MKILSNIQYFIVEGIKNIFLHGFMSISAIGIIASCFAVTGCFSLLSLNIDKMVKDIQSQSQIRVFIDDSVSDEDAEALESTIEQIQHISEIEYVSREKALEEYRDELGEDASFLDGLENDNPLRNGYRIKLEALEYHNEVTENLKNTEGIASVQDNKDASNKLITLRRLANGICMALVAMLGGISIFIISNSVKMATFARREEIAIMKMVGATNSFVRWPFIIEGLLLGELGAGLSYLVQFGFYKLIGDMISGGLNFVQIYEFSEISPTLLLVLLICGAVVGVGGSMSAIRKFLKV